MRINRIFPALVVAVLGSAGTAAAQCGPAGSHLNGGFQINLGTQIVGGSSPSYAVITITNPNPSSTLSYEVRTRESCFAVDLGCAAPITIVQGQTPVQTGYCFGNIVNGLPGRKTDTILIDLPGVGCLPGTSAVLIDINYGMTSGAQAPFASMELIFPDGERRDHIELTRNICR